MKKTLLILAFVLSLIFVFSIVSLAQETENTYYVVQSEESELAASLIAEGKCIVGIDKLYSSPTNAMAENSTYFISQFDGKTLNLILAEDVSYRAGNDTGPRATGIRLDKAVTLNVYFNGHSWWIPDDNNYSGFFVNNQNAHLSLIGNRTLEEVSAPFNPNSVSATVKSSKVDYYAGYVGLYIEKGDVTVKNAVIIGHDELIYQRKDYASGTTVLTLDTCMVRIKNSNYDPISLKCEGTGNVASASATIRFNHLYTDDVQINNIMEGSYINNSVIKTFYTDSWHANDRIGKDYIYINNTTINEYTTYGDCQHPIAKNSTFGKINLTGDTSGGAYATLIDSTYTELYLVRRYTEPKRNGILYIVTEADCENAATRIVYTYDDAKKANVSSVDEEYPKNNPALGHSTKNNPLAVSYTSFLEKGNGLFVCDVCSKEYEEEVNPLFAFLGYSVMEGENASVAIGYEIDTEALKVYEDVTKKTVNYGVYAVSKDKIGDKDIFGADGNVSEGVINVDLTEYNFRIIELKIRGISEEYKNSKLTMGAYVMENDGEKTSYSYLQYGKINENEKYSFTSYNEILEVMPPEIIPFEDIEVVVGDKISLPKTAFVNGVEKTLTYTFEDSSISIEDYVLTGLSHTNNVKVTVSGKGVQGEFNVTVRDYSVYKYVVVIGVDGAGAYFANANTPNLDKIFANGALTYNCLTSNPTISAQCWGSLLHGVTPNLHGLTNDIAAAGAYPNDSSYPSFFRVIRENNENAVLASFAGWNPINVGIVEDGIGVYKKGGMSDSALTAEILAYLAQNNPNAMFIQFDEADAAGHSSGYGTATQLAKIAEIDAYIGQIYDSYMQKGILNETLFIVTSDHGGNGTNHGGLTDAEKYVMFAATGKTVVSGTIGDMEIRDTAAIVLHALGYEQPEKWSARVPSNLFNGVEAPLHRPGTAPGRYHETEATPEKGSEGYVTNFVDNKLNTYLTFDGNVADNCGGNTTPNKTITYKDGYYGQGAALNGGYVTLEDFDPSMVSFTMSFWMKASSISSDPCIISNKNWDSGQNAGFALTFINKNGIVNVRLNYGENRNKRADCDFALPSDYTNGWVHIIAIFDRENNKLGLSIDFADIKTSNIPENLQGTSLDAGLKTNIGQDGRGTYNQALPAIIDEFMIFEGAFTQEDVNALMEYYGMKN